MWGRLELEENLCCYWRSKSCDGEGTYCSMWGCRPYQHWCPRQWRDQCPSDHLACEEKDRKREISVTSLQLTSTSYHKIFLLKTVRSFIQLPQATEIFLPPSAFKSDGDRKTNIRWQRCVCVCLRRTKHCPFPPQHTFLRGKRCGRLGSVMVSKKNYTFLFLSMQGSKCGQRRAGWAKTHI